MLTVGLLFHSSNSDNLGVGALTVSQVEILRGISQATGIEIGIRLFDWVGERPSYVEGTDITIFHLNGELMKDPRRMIALFRECDVMLDIGAGDSFADIYGPERLRRMIYLKYLVHLARCPVVLAPQTFGPFSSWLTRRIAKDLLRRAVLVATRDDQSTAALRGLGVTRPIVTASDVALRLLPVGPKMNRTRPCVGLNISGLLMGGGYTGYNQFQLTADYPAAMRSLITRLLALTEQPEIVLVPHVLGASTSGEDDLEAALALQKQFPEVGIAPAFHSPGEAKAYIAGLDFLAGARMHACIAALSSGVAVVPLAYSDKFQGLFGSLGYEATVDCRNAGQEAIVQSVLSGYRNRETLAHQCKIARKVGEDRLRDYTEALARVISEAALRKRSGDQALSAPAHRWRTMDERL
ncbi:polysaccharide pyruvyl transferase family protein [Litoreibacter janthinus]|uniref:Polysaccharide pyruvyl transferase family protein WcaK n=1 Tax=Litoreibacter janthinus TaxID=670154 RepID=A0A1I6FYR2_9RHOB|nr:polysaccharide pyruvyl transferase family protein [Litoreibacter janthinus]SFR35040.1 Polysaccharide pyruvyl transferase family protein WcaK [Litoreibacter janthinus]